MDDLTQIPVRDHMDDPNIIWRHSKPDYELVNKKYMAERTRNHAPGSVERIVENLVKTWEMESSHKMSSEDWKTVNLEKYEFIVNGGKPLNVADNIEMGNYNMLLSECPLYNKEGQNNDTSHAVFKEAFPEGFAWELLEVLSGQPKVTFTWRHWANWSGPYRGNEPTNEPIEMTGCCIATVDDALKIEKLEIFYDPNPMMATLTKFKTSNCPVAK
ncbi:pathogen-related protein-like isoform X1 [Anneissia japonica]|uniref:pathogen-related protein-like isoform X1 n=1 Tax=Anneissia japonica TaxID=1529436 RepID=UPI0014258455|nr:pathogen-related protein-like isoform X1 [Anneissia japonica]